MSTYTALSTIYQSHADALAELVTATAHNREFLLTMLESSTVDRRDMSRDKAAANLATFRTALEAGDLVAAMRCRAVPTGAAPGSIRAQLRRYYRALAEIVEIEGVLGRLEEFAFVAQVNQGAKRSQQLKELFQDFQGLEVGKDSDSCACSRHDSWRHSHHSMYNRAVLDLLRELDLVEVLVGLFQAELAAPDHYVDDWGPFGTRLILKDDVRQLLQFLQPHLVSA